MKKWITKVGKEPLPWFLLAGLSIFLVDTWWREQANSGNEIRITTQQIEGIADKWEMQMGRAPTPSELSGLMEDQIREEVMYREALKIGLDKDDTIIRRRLAQKLAFLVDDSLVNENPEKDVLLSWFLKNKKNYQYPEVYSFAHIYFRGANESSLGRAESAMKEISEGNTANLFGDPFMQANQFFNVSEKEVARSFGRAFSLSLSEIPSSNKWSGPVESVYGYHLIQMRSRKEGRQLLFEEVRQRVLDDYLAAERKRIAEKHYNQLKAEYDIRLPSDT